MKNLLYTLIFIVATLLTGCANAGKDQTVMSMATVILDASKSTASVGGKLTKYNWRQTKGPHVTLQDPNAKLATFIAPNVTQETLLVFELTTTETGGSISTFVTKDTVSIHVKVPDERIQWFLDQHEDLKHDYFEGKYGVDSNPSGWDNGAYMRAYLDMYQGSHDVRFLRKLNELLQIVADGNDILTGRKDDITGKVMPGWGTREYDYGPNGGERDSEMLLNALHAYPLAAFARIVKENPELKNEFGADADRYYHMVKELYEAHQPFRHDEKSPYANGTDGMYFAYPENYYEDRIDFSGIEAPINITAIIAEPLVEMYRASVADGSPNDQYKDIIVKVGNYIDANMTYVSKPNKKPYPVWCYWPADIDTTTRDRMEDLTHGARVSEFLISLAHAGVDTLWSEEKLTDLANTFTCGAVIDEGTFANYIDGTGGIYQGDPATLYDWLELQPYSHHSCNTILYHLNYAMQETDEDEYYNIAVLAKFFRFDEK